MEAMRDIVSREASSVEDPEGVGDDPGVGHEPSVDPEADVVVVGTFVLVVLLLELRFEFQLELSVLLFGFLLDEIDWELGGSLGVRQPHQTWKSWLHRKREAPMSHQRRILWSLIMFSVKLKGTFPPQKLRLQRNNALAEDEGWPRTEMFAIFNLVGGLSRRKRC